MITLYTPMPNMNEMIKLRGQKGFAYNRTKQRLQEVMGWELIGQKKPEFKFPQSFIFNWYCKNKKMDKDNIAAAKKFVFDTLVKIEWIPNDTWEFVGDWSDKFFIDLKNPRLEIELVDT